MSATEFTVDMTDIQFALHEQLKLTEVMGRYENYADFDRELYDQMLEEAEKIATQVIAPANRVADREGCVFDGEGNVTTPAGFKEAWEVMAEGGWIGLSAPEEFGGMGMPHTLDLAIGEMFTGASMAFATYSGLSRGAANLLAEFASADHRQLECEKLFSGEWGATMCLTEADAGTAVGDNRARAVLSDEEGVYHLTGEKMFITAGDQDLTENILHLVLARTPDAPNGTRGLSIFLVPKFMYDEEGNLGERNGAFVQSIEEKMGIHGSCTCVLALGADQPCKGWLLGRENGGMRIMFHMMNEARIGVGLQGLSGAAAAYNNARSYARERIQGTSIKDFKNADAPRVAIVQHPDVRRMLMWQRVHVETMRSLLLTTAMRLDRANNAKDDEERKRLMGLVELMTPICKAYCSDRGFDVTVSAVQVYGGYGYIGEYPVEQHLRDAKISSIYEGTNGIQAIDLLGRKMRMEGGQLFMTWISKSQAELERCRKLGIFEDEVAAIEKALGHTGATAMHLAGLGMSGDLPSAMLQATPFLDLMGNVVLALHAVWQARIAHERAESGEGAFSASFYRGKELNLKFYIANVLPQAVALAKSIQAGDTSCMDDVLFNG